MKKILVFLGVILLLWSGPAFAIPALQLYVPGGTFDTGDETWKIDVQSGNIIVTALAIDQGVYGSGNQNAFFDDSSTQAYLSVALGGNFQGPGYEDPAAFGTLTVNTTTYPTGSWNWAIPPVDDYGLNPDLDPVDLPPHGIYPTWCFVVPFSFDPNDNDGIWDTYGNVDPLSGYNVYGGRENFTIGGIGGLYGIADYVHFDLYTINNVTGKIHRFAPFSHDAEGTPIPEPATLLLLGTGLIGMAGIGRKKFKK